MFNVTILKMRDLIKYLLGVIFTITLVIFISKQFQKENKSGGNVINKVENGISMISEQTLIGSFEQAVPIIANINEEYSRVAKEDDHSKEDLLQGILKTQISSIKNIEDGNIEKTTSNIENDKTNNTQQSSTRSYRTKYTEQKKQE